MMVVMNAAIFSTSEAAAAIDADRITELETMFNDKAPIAKLVGARLSFDRETRLAEFTMAADRKVLHAGGGVHGGVYCLLLDSACWFAAAVHFPRDTWLSTADLNVHFLRACGPDRSMRCVGKVLKMGTRSSVCIAELFDDQGALLAYATGTIALVSGVPRYGRPASEDRSLTVSKM